MLPATGAEWAGRAATHCSFPPLSSHPGLDGGEICFTFNPFILIRSSLDYLLLTLSTDTKAGCTGLVDISIRSASGSAGFSTFSAYCYDLERWNTQKTML